MKWFTAAPSQVPNKKEAPKLTTALFTVYLIALYWILIMKLGVHFSYMGKRSVNLIPFRNYFLYNSKLFSGEVVLNILIFIPLGVYVGMIFQQWKFEKKFLLIGAISFIIEAIQYGVAIGAFDSTDIVTNTSGGIIGLWLIWIVGKTFTNWHKAQLLVNSIATIATVVMVVFLVLLKLDLLPIRYR